MDKNSALFFLGYDVNDVLSSKQIEGLKEKNIYAYSTPCGKESARVIDNFIYDNSIKYAVGIGFCGGLGRNMKIGKMLMPNETLYHNSIAFPYGNLAEKIIKTLNEYPFHPARIETIDSLNIENRRFLERMRAKKVDAIDMELFHFFAKCNKSNMQSAAILVVSDIPDGNAPETIHIPRDVTNLMPYLAEICAGILAD